jgi:hypothetical protein
MTKKLSFYSRALRKQLDGFYSVEEGVLTVQSADRTRKIRVQTSIRRPNYLARQILIEIENGRTD